MMSQNSDSSTHDPNIRPSEPPSLDDMETEVYGSNGITKEEADKPSPRGYSANSGSLKDDITRVGYQPSESDETLLDSPIKKPTEAIFWVKEGRRRGKYYPINSGTIIGREEGTLILDDPKVSSTHAKITYESGHYVIWDFGSSNGVYVNGKRCREATPLNENDQVKIGDTVLLVKLLEVDKKPIKKSTTSKKPSTSKLTKKVVTAGRRKKPGAVNK
jgi:hypothetical protein